MLNSPVGFRFRKLHGVEERPGAAGNPPRTGNDHELPAMLFFAHLDQFFELKAVGTCHSYGHDLEQVVGNAFSMLNGQDLLHDSPSDSIQMTV